MVAQTSCRPSDPNSSTSGRGSPNRRPHGRPSQDVGDSPPGKCWCAAIETRGLSLSPDCEPPLGSRLGPVSFQGGGALAARQTSAEWLAGVEDTSACFADGSSRRTRCLCAASFLGAARAYRRARAAVMAGYLHHPRLARSLKC